ncbi:hypothetical protein V8G54_016539 [Vigna mungo]|uniref:Uncharacterized protein n=1 Tax=Vigna mungo TaxID=3915 RepID=A0AAQ3RXY3_VIGMU
MSDVLIVDHVVRPTSVSIPLKNTFLVSMENTGGVAPGHGYRASFMVFLWVCRMSDVRVLDHGRPSYPFHPSNVICGRESHFRAIFNFGDSNSDTGGLSAAFGQAPPPNGIMFLHSPKGRFSDGRLNQFYSAELGLALSQCLLELGGVQFQPRSEFRHRGIHRQTSKHN